MFAQLSRALLSVLVVFVSGVAAADEPSAGPPAPPARGPERTRAAEGAEPVPLNKSGTILLDRTGKRLLLKTKVVCRECALEMLLCKKQTKEHESILALDGQAYVIHTGLLALGAEPGTPVQFVRPKPGGEPGEVIEDYRPPTGQKIEIYLQWTDEKGQPERVKAQEWMRYATRRFYGAPLSTLPPVELPEDSELRYDARNRELSWYGIMPEKQRDEFLALSDNAAWQTAIRKLFKDSQVRPMKADFVFAGSSYYVDDDGNRFYQAESGDVVCVANFPTALIDVAIPSTASGETNLLFEGWTERIPPLETEVLVELVPIFKDGKPVISGQEPPADAGADQQP